MNGHFGHLCCSTIFQIRMQKSLVQMALKVQEEVMELQRQREAAAAQAAAAAAAAAQAAATARAAFEANQAENLRFMKSTPRRSL